MSDDDLSIPDFLRRTPGTTPRPVELSQTPEQSKFVVNTAPAAPTTSAFTKRPSPSKNAIPRQLHYMLALTEGMIDDVIYAGYNPPSVYDALISIDAPTTVARSIVTKYTPYLEELREIKPGCDPQLWEGYSTWSRTEINRMIDLVSAIVDEAARYVGNKRAVRPLRPWKARQPKAQRQIRDLKYLREWGELRLVSLDPMKIIGSMTLWTYDVKRRLLCMYVSNSRAGFMIRGTTIQHIDAERSLGKKLRKPQETLTAILSASKTGAVDLTREIKTKSTPPKGRINNNTIILRSQ